MFRYLLSTALILSGCSDTNFGGSGGSAEVQKKPPSTSGGNPGGSTSDNPGGSTSGNPGGSTSGNPGGSTTGNPGESTTGNPGGSTTGNSSGLGSTDGGNSIQNVMLGVGMIFDGVTTITINLQTGVMSYNNTATIVSGRLSALQVQLKDANGSSIPFQVPLGGSAQIPNWRPAKGANLTGQENYTRNGNKPGNPPIVQWSVNSGNFELIINDDVGYRPSWIKMDNLNLGLQY